MFPPWVLNVYPRPGRAYIGSVDISLSATLDLNVIGSSETLPEIKEQIELLIDGQEVSVPGPFFHKYTESNTLAVVINRFSAEPGDHTATVRFHARSGRVFEYSWPFSYFPQEQMMPGLPPGVRSVRPLPDSVLSVAEYEQGEVVPPEFQGASIDLTGGICIDMQPGDILGPGFYTGDEVAEHYGFVSLDGSAIDSLSDWRLELVYENGYGLIRDEQEDIIGQYEGPHSAKCLRIGLEPGKHEVTIYVDDVRRGYAEFIWRFRLIECQ